MANAVQTFDKVLPPSDQSVKKSLPKQPTSSFDDELKKATPKPKPAAKASHGDRNAAPKKAARPGKSRRGDVRPHDKSERDDRVEKSDDEKAECSADENHIHQAEGEHVEKSEESPKVAKKADADKSQTDEAAKSADADTNPGEQVAALNPDGGQSKQSPQSNPEEEDQDGQKLKQPTAAIDADLSENPDESELAATDANIDGATDDADPDAVATDAKSSMTNVATKTDKKQAAKTPAQHKDRTAAIELGGAPLVDEEPGSHPQAQSHDESSSDNQFAELSSAAIASIANRVGHSEETDPAPVSASHDASSSSVGVDLQAKNPAAQQVAARPAPVAPPPPPAPPEVQFAEANHPAIVSGVRGQLLPNGGTMHIRLDPPELGALQVSIHMRDGQMTASFETSNDEATKLLSHSLAQLKHGLEAQGVTVDKIHVTQSPRDQQASNEENRQQPGTQDDPTQRREQQRREIIQRMWRRLRDGSDPVDMVA